MQLEVIPQIVVTERDVYIDKYVLHFFSLFCVHDSALNIVIVSFWSVHQVVYVVLSPCKKEKKKYLLNGNEAVK